jgi:hypothetical protein
MKSSLLRLNVESLRYNLFTKSFLLCILFLFTAFSIVKAEDDGKLKSTSVRREQSQGATHTSMQQAEAVDEGDRDDYGLPISFARDLYFVIEDSSVKFTKDKYASIRKSRKDRRHLKLPTVFPEKRFILR